MAVGLYIFLGIIVFFILTGLKVVNEYERGVKFTFGRFSSIMKPGWRIVIPLFQTWERVDIRTKVVDVPDQDCMTKDNISVNVNAVVYYKVTDASKAILEVEHFMYAVSQFAQTTMRNIIGEVELDELLSNREEISAKIELIVDKATDPWGIKIESVALKDVILPADMKRVMGKQAEAEREKRAVIIKAEGETMAAENISKAANTLARAPGALHLRTLQTINDISSDQSNTIVFAVPLEVLRAFEAVGNMDADKAIEKIVQAKIKKQA
jgi:regulator of protease activity HflC (stomatin/prohibitin superfamily)